MVGWHHRLNEREFKQAQGDSEGQESLVCCSLWGHKELDTNERLNNDNNYMFSKPRNFKSFEVCSLIRLVLG